MRPIIIDLLRWSRSRILGVAFIVYCRGIFVLYCVVLYLSISIALLTAFAFQKRSRPQQLTLCRNLHAEALHATLMKDLPKVPTWRLERDLNPRPSRRKTSTLPIRHHVQLRRW